MEIRWENGGRYPLIDKSENGTSEDGASLTLDCEEERLYVSHYGMDSDEFILWFEKGELNWKISQYLTCDEANELLEKAAPLAEKVIEGYSSRNGRFGKKAYYDEDAKEAIAKIQEIALSYDYVSPSDVQDCLDWVYENGKYQHIPKIEVRRIGSEEDPYPLYHVDDRNGEVRRAYLHFDVMTEELWVDWGCYDSARHKDPIANN